MPRPVTTFLAGIVFLGCAPQQEAAPPDCSFEAQYPELIKLLQSPELQPVVDVVQVRLLDTGLLEPALAAAVATLQAAPPPAAPPPAAPAAPPATSGAPSAGSVSRSLALYIVGDPPATTAHYDVTTAIGDTLHQCRELIVLADELLNTPIPAGCALTDAGCDLAWHAIIVAVHGLVATPSIRDLLGNVGATSLSEDVFVELIQTFTGYFKSPNLDFSAVDTFAQTYLLPLVTDPQLRTALQDLLSTIEQVLAPEVGVEAALAASLTCFESHDPNGSVYRMLYALLGDSGFQTSEIVASTPAPGDTTVAWVGQLARYLRGHEVATDALTHAGATLLAQDNASVVLPSLLRAADAGLFANSSTLLTPQPCPRAR